MRLPLVTASLKPEPDTWARTDKLRASGRSRPSRHQLAPGAGERAEFEADRVASRRHRDGAEQDVRAPDRSVRPIDRREPPRVIGVVQDDVPTALRIRFDRHLVVAVRNDTGRAAAFSVRAGLGPTVTLEQHRRPQVHVRPFAAFQHGGEIRRRRTVREQHARHGARVLVQIRPPEVAEKFRSPGRSFGSIVSIGAPVAMRRRPRRSARVER